LYQHFTKKEKAKPLETRVYFLIAVPCFFDLVGTVLEQFGLLYISASLYMLVRSFVIIVTAILKVLVLKNKLAKHMWLGIGINVTAMVLVSIPSFLLPSENTSRDPRIGILLIICACVIEGAQFVVEERLMKVDEASPYVVCGLEGAWGCLFMLIAFPICYFIPGSDKGSMENVWDAIVMLNNSGPLTAYFLITLVSVAAYNACAEEITGILSSIWKAILDNFRTITVWVLDLILFYSLSSGVYGEKWEWPGSYVQLGGMLTLFFGTLVYNGSVPFLRWEVPNEKNKKKDKVEDDRLLEKDKSKTQNNYGAFHDND